MILTVLGPSRATLVAACKIDSTVTAGAGAVTAARRRLNFAIRLSRVRVPVGGPGRLRRQGSQARQSHLQHKHASAAREAAAYPGPAAL